MGSVVLPYIIVSFTERRKRKQQGACLTLTMECVRAL
jgi:hypothetical protein